MALTLSHPRILAFFEQHSNLDPEQTVVQFIDIMEKLHDSMSKTTNNTAILDILSTMNQKMDNVCRVNDDIQQQFALRMGELKKEYMEDLRMMLTCNVSEKIEPLLKEHNTTLFEKTNAMMAAVIPQNETAMVGRIESVVKGFQDTITADTKQLLATSIDAPSFQRYMNDFDEKIQVTIANSHNIIRDSLEHTERRLDGRMDNIASASNQVNGELHKSVNTLLGKFENSSSKGQMSENLLHSVLSNLYPSADLEQVGQTKETGDIMLQRATKSKILVENKDWSRPVPQAEVAKFIRDIEVQDCSGIFLSQNGPITSKENFEVDFHDGNVLVYVHDVHNDPERIKIAIDIVDHLESLMGDLDLTVQQGNHEAISKEMVRQLNTELHAFTEAKLALITTTKNFQKTLLKQIDDLRMPTLEEFLGKKFSCANTAVYKCDYCDYTHPTKQGRSAHMRGCIARKQKQGAPAEITIT